MVHAGTRGFSLPAPFFAYIESKKLPKNMLYRII